MRGRREEEEEEEEQRSRRIIAERRGRVKSFWAGPEAKVRLCLVWVFWGRCAGGARSILRQSPSLPTFYALCLLHHLTPCGVGYVISLGQEFNFPWFGTCPFSHLYGFCVVVLVVVAEEKVKLLPLAGHRFASLRPLSLRGAVYE